MLRIFFLPLVLVLLSGCSEATESASAADGIHASAADVQPPLVGAAAPAFTARHVDGSEYAFDPAEMSQPTILVFYRGGWCPYCNAQLMELRKIEDDINALGYQWLFLSADSPETLSAVAAEEGEDAPELQYTLLSDNDLDAATAYGIAFRLDDETFQRYREHGLDLEEASGRDHHALPVPSVFIVNKEGTLVFHYVNVDYRQRISPDLLLAAARAGLDPRDVRARNVD